MDYRDGIRAAVNLICLACNSRNPKIQALLSVQVSQRHRCPYSLN